VGLTLIDHIRELRQRVLFSAIFVMLGTCISFFYFDFLIALFSAPFDALASADSPTLFVHSLFEGFFTKMKFSFLFGFVVAFPFLLFQVLRFLVPGLKKNERWILFVSLLLGACLAAFSVILVYLYLLPFSIDFLTSYQFIPKKVGLMLNYQNNVFYVFNMLFASMILFQFPIVLFLLMQAGVLTRQMLLSSGRYIVVLIFLLSAIVTPPDVVSQLGFALPLIMMFYGTIVLAKCVGVGR
jgi:sec-independent protein translocase protein TatC